MVKVKGLVEVNNDQVVTSSRDVAKVFDRRHKNITQAIDGINKDLEGVSKNQPPLFCESTYIHPQNKQEYREVLMNRDGFTLLAMGFTGKEAMQFKMRYIEAFNQMEQQLSMQVRDSYVIEDPISRAEAWIREQREREQLQLETKQQKEIIGELKPKADYTDKVLQSEGLMSISQIAKDYGMSAVKMNNLLHEYGIQYKQGDQWLLYKEYQDKGYVQSETYSYTNPKGTFTRLHTKWRQRGRLFIYEFLKREGILPTMEMEDIEIEIS